MCERENTVSDGELVRRLRAGDPDAFDRLFAKHRQGIFAYLRQRCGDAGLAEDVTQEVFVELVRRLDRIDPRRGVSGWLYRVARNRMIDVMRHRRFETLPGEDFFRSAARRRTSGEDRGPAAGLLAAERAARLQRVLATLPEKERDVLTMRYFGDLSFKEIAAATRRPLGTVLWQAHRAVRRLREQLEGEPEG